MKPYIGNGSLVELRVRVGSDRKVRSVSLPWHDPGPCNKCLGYTYMEISDMIEAMGSELRNMLQRATSICTAPVNVWDHASAKMRAL